MQKLKNSSLCCGGHPTEKVTDEALYLDLDYRGGRVLNSGFWVFGYEIVFSMRFEDLTGDLRRMW